MKIYLIGMPGSGKTTLGRQLADVLSLPFVDLDQEIEKTEGIHVKEIFSTKGEDYFRAKESALLKKWADTLEGFVLATGGGAPCFHKGIDLINASGLSIFLDVPVHELVERTVQNMDRPLLQVSGQVQDEDKRQLLEKKIKLLRDARLPVYKRAAIIIDKASIQLEDVLDKIKK